MVDGICFSQGMQGVPGRGADGKKYCYVEDPKQQATVALPYEEQSLAAAPKPAPLYTGPVISAAPAKKAPPKAPPQALAQKTGNGFWQWLTVGVPVPGAIACAPTIDYEKCVNGTDPQVSGTPQVDKTTVALEEEITVTLPASAVKDCAGEFNEALQVQFVTQDGDQAVVVDAVYDEESKTYTAKIKFSTAGSKSIAAQVYDSSEPNAKVVQGYQTASVYVKEAEVVEPENQVCQTAGFQVEGPTPASEYDVENPAEVTWKIYTGSCEGNFSAEVDFGPLGKKTFTADENGVITVVTTLSQKITGAFTATIRDAEGKALPGKILLYPPYYADPVEPPESQCVYSTNPVILGEIETDLPVDNIQANEEVTFMIPAELVAGCDESSQLEAVFIINNQTVPAELNGDGLYVARHTFTQPGNKVVTFRVADTNPEHQTPEGKAPTAQVQINFYVKPLESEVEVDVCAASGEPKVGILMADKSVVKEGDPVTFTLTGVGDCDGGEANLLVELQAYGVSVEMVPAGNGSYVTTMAAVLTGPPFKAIVTDLERGTSTTRELWNIPTVLPSSATPPVVNMAVTPTFGDSPLPVMVDLSNCYAVDEGDEITHFEVNWGDGNIETVSGNSAEHVYLCLGGSCHHTLRVTAHTLNGGSASQQTTITVWDNEE